MSGICGWVGLSSEVVANEETLQHMAGHLPPRGHSQILQNNASSALCSKPTSHSKHVCAGNNLSAVYDGTPTWRDNSLSRHQLENGTGSAILKAYEMHGASLFNKIKGPFSLVISNFQANDAVLAIDRLGIQPLYYALPAQGGIVFGSTAKSVRSHPAVNKDIDLQSIYDYVYFHEVPSPGCIFKDINKLEPGTCLVYRDGKINIKKYWEPKYSKNSHETFDDLKTELRRLLSSSVASCNDGKQIGTFLSGGIDSSTVSGVLREVRGEAIQAYTVGFAEEGFDEVNYARIAAGHFDFDLHEYYVTPEDIVEAIPTVARAYDEPFGNSSAIPALFCARHAANNGIQVLLAGDGGDELFAGNERYAKQKLFDIYTHVPEFIRSGLLEPTFLGSTLSTKTYPTRKIRRYIEQARIKMPERMETYNHLHKTNLSETFHADFLNEVETGHPLALMQGVYDKAPGDSLLDRMLYYDWKFTLADNDLRKVNRMCEVSGIEVRYPLLDDDLVEFSARIPASLKLKRLKLRYFIKRALDDFLPKAILNKEKQGFGLPFGQWLKTSPLLQDLIYSNLEQLKHRNIFKNSFIDGLKDTHRMDPSASYYGTMIWVMAMLEQWFQEHNIDI